MTENQTGLNRGLSSNLQRVSKANNVKFIEKCVMYMEKYDFKKLSIKEKVLGAVVYRKGHPNSLLGHERTHQK